jgi:TonB family protein
VQRGYQRVLVVLAISVVVHVPLVYASALSLLRSATPEGEPRYFDVTPVAQSSDPRNPNEEERDEDEDYEPKDEQPDGQVVDAPEAGERRRPEQARFLSDRDQVVEHETRPSLQLPGDRRQPQPSVPPLLASAQRPGTARDQRDVPPGLVLRDRGLEPESSGDHEADQAPPPMNEGELELRPTYAALSDAVGGTGLDDLRNLEEGDGTLLTTARWLHAPFFQRVKEQVEQYWHPDLAFARHDPGGHVYGYRDRETVIQVVLDSQGALVRNYVLRASGADFLDEEALHAIEQAAPFPNPPRGLVDQQSQHIVFTFGFTVELGEQPIFRVRRYR